MLNPRVSLDQWRAFVAVVDHGGYAKAADELHKTQSSVSYAVHRVEDLLDVRLFERQGRRAVLTPGGQVLYQRAVSLLDRAGNLEHGAAEFGDNWEPELRLAVEIVFPTWVLLEALEQFGARFPQTRVQLYETVLGGMDEALLDRRVDLALTPFIPQGFAGDPLLPVRFIAAAHPDHPLHHLGRPVTLDDLKDHRHLVIRDSAQQRPRDSGSWIGTEQRWTVSHKATQIRAACMGLGFAWFPEQAIRKELDEGRLAPLPMREGAERHAQVYLVFTDPDAPPRAARAMADILQEHCDNRELESPS